MTSTEQIHKAQWGLTAADPEGQTISLDVPMLGGRETLGNQRRLTAAGPSMQFFIWVFCFSILEFPAGSFLKFLSP